MAAFTTKAAIIIDQCCCRCHHLWRQRIKVSGAATLSIFGSTLNQKKYAVPQPTLSQNFPRQFHLTCKRFDRTGTVAERQQENYRKRKEVVLFNELSELKEAKDKETFMQAIKIYEEKQSVYKRGHVDFILGALEQMKEFDVHKDKEVYKALMKVFPEGELVAKNLIQTEFMHFPRQQNTALELLSAMNDNGVVPDDAMGDIVVSRFGKHSYVMKKYRRMMYWMPKFKNMNPYPTPYILPRSNAELAVLALNRMAVDKRTQVNVYNSSDLITDASDDTFVASATSPAQRELLSRHNPDRPLFVEGGFLVWLKDQSLVYFILRSDPRPELEYNKKMDEMDREDVSSGFYSYIGADDEGKKRSALLAEPSIHEQPEGVILAMCITGTSSKESLVSWITFLQEESPPLADIPVVFSLRTPESGVQTADYTAEPEEPDKIAPGPT